MLIMFSATIGVLYYMGVIQVLIEKIAFVMQFTLGTGAIESLHAAFNIFVGWVGCICYDCTAETCNKLQLFQITGMIECIW